MGQESSANQAPKNTNEAAESEAQERKELEAQEEAAREQATARNKEVQGLNDPAKDVKATTPVAEDQPLHHALKEAQDRGYIGGEPFSERLADEQRQALIRAGLDPAGGALPDA